MWGNDQYSMPNMMGMPQMLQNMMPSPLMPPVGLLGELNMPPVNSAPSVASLIGPVAPDNFNTEDMNVQDDVEEVMEAKYTEGRGGRKENRDRSRDRSRRPRSRDRYDRNDRSSRNDRNDRNDRNRDRDRRDRRSKWDTDPVASLPGQNEMPMGNMVMQSTMMPYGNMNNMIDQQNAEGMPNISTMQGMVNMQAMHGMHNIPNMMSGMNMLPNIMDQNMMNQTIMMPNQPIYMSRAILLPPIPGTSMINRREEPNGCRTIFVGGLPKGTSEDIIREIFQRFGSISDVKMHRQGVCHVRFEKHESMEQSFFFSGYRLKSHDQSENEATTLYIDYALNRDDQTEYERSKWHRESTPPRVEPFSPAALNAVSDKIKSDDQFAEAAPTLAVWLERGECNKKNANSFYSLIQASNNQMRRIFAEKMSLDDEYQNMKAMLREKLARIVMQFEQVAKILTAAKHQRVSDHFTKQQRRNIEMWLKMTEEVDNIKEELNVVFNEEETEKMGKNVVSLEKYEKLKTEKENLTYELEGYKNEAYLVKNEAERKFEKFKAHFIAQQALNNSKTSRQEFSPIPPSPHISIEPVDSKPQPSPTDDNKVIISKATVTPSAAKLISILTAFLMVHPLGASLDYLVSYVRSMVPSVTQATVHQVLQKYEDVFCRKTTGIGASIETRWCFVTFDVIKKENDTISDH